MCCMHHLTNFYKLSYRLWDEAEKLEQEHLKAESDRLSEQRQTAAEAYESQKPTIQNVEEIVTPGSILDLYEFQVIVWLFKTDGWIFDIFSLLTDERRNI